MGGYEPAEHFRCTIASFTDDATKATAEYFGVWRIDAGACAELPCTSFPANLGSLGDATLPSGYSTSTCGSNVDESGNFSMASGKNCSVTCAPGYVPKDDQREFVC